jgi:hypothetical protein
MLPAAIQFIIAMVAHAINERMARRVDYLQEEVRVLKETLATATGKIRIDFTAEHRRRLPLKGKHLTAEERRACCQIVRPETILARFRQALSVVLYADVSGITMTYGLDVFLASTPSHRQAARPWPSRLQPSRTRRRAPSSRRGPFGCVPLQRVAGCVDGHAGRRADHADGPGRPGRHVDADLPDRVDDEVGHSIQAVSSGTAVFVLRGAQTSCFSQTVTCTPAP